MNQPLFHQPSTPTVWQGKLELAFTQTQSGTQLARSFMQAPLKVQRPFYPEGAAICHVVTLHTAGGIVGGDRLSSTIELHPQSQALMTTAAAAKVYRSNGREASQQTQIRLGTGACLEWLPQETIVFDGAIYQQDLRVELATDAVWLGWDLVRFGRSARQERFASGTWRSRTEVWQSDRLVWVDPQYLQGGSEMLDSPHGLAGYPVVGSFALIGRSVSAALVEQIRHEVWRTQASPSTPTSDHDAGINAHTAEPTSSLIPASENPRPLPHPSSSACFGVTRLMTGVLCRYRGNSTAEARRGFMAMWDLLRMDVLDRPVCKPRIWQL